MRKVSENTRFIKETTDSKGKTTVVTDNKKLNDWVKKRFKKK